MTKIRTMVVDDEPMARERIVGLLSQEKDIEMVGSIPTARRPFRRSSSSIPTSCSSMCRCRRVTASA